jgi:hypothetical protein
VHKETIEALREYQANFEQFITHLNPDMEKGAPQYSSKKSDVSDLNDRDSSDVNKEARHST